MEAEGVTARQRVEVPVGGVSLGGSAVVTKSLLFVGTGGVMLCPVVVEAVGVISFEVLPTVRAQRGLTVRMLLHKPRLRIRLDGGEQQVVSGRSIGIK